MEVADGDEGGARPAAAAPIAAGDTAFAADARRLPVAVHPVGGGDRQEAGSRDVLGYRDNSVYSLAVDPGRVEN